MGVKMIHGRSGGSGKYSYREASSRNRSVHVSHMPEDIYEVRIVFRHNGETSIPIVKIGESEAELLWSALNAMAKDLNWDDQLSSEIDKE